MTKTADAVCDAVKGDRTMSPDSWAKLIQYVGFPIVVCIALGMLYNGTLNWERERMLPTLEKTAEALNTNSEVLRGFRQTIEKLPAQFRVEREREAAEKATK